MCSILRYFASYTALYTILLHSAQLYSTLLYITTPAPYSTLQHSSLYFCILYYCTLLLSSIPYSSLLYSGQITRSFHFPYQSLNSVYLLDSIFSLTKNKYLDEGKILGWEWTRTVLLLDQEVEEFIYNLQASFLYWREYSLYHTCIWIIFFLLFHSILIILCIISLLPPTNICSSVDIITTFYNMEAKLE